MRRSMNNLNEIESDWGLKPKLLKSVNWLPAFQQWPERFLTRISRTIASEWLRVLYKGRFVSYGELLENSAISLRDGTRRVSIASINDYLDRGATVVVRSADSYDSEFFSLTEALSNRFRCRVSCNFYAVREEGRGYGPHFDTHHGGTCRIQNYRSPNSPQCLNFKHSVGAWKNCER